MPHADHHDLVGRVGEDGKGAATVARAEPGVGGPEVVNRPQDRIASPNQHPIRMTAKQSTAHGVCGVAKSPDIPQRWSKMMSKPLNCTPPGLTDRKAHRLQSLKTGGKRPPKRHISTKSPSFTRVQEKGTPSVWPCPRAARAMQANARESAQGVGVLYSVRRRSSTGLRRRPFRSRSRGSPHRSGSRPRRHRGSCTRIGPGICRPSCGRLA